MQQQHVHNTCDMTKHCTIIACLQRLLILLPIILETNTTNVVAFAQPSSNTSPPSESPTTAATTDMLQSASRRVAMKVISPSVHRQRAVVQLAQELIRIPSITPKDLECQDVIRNRLEPLGFQCEAIKFEDVTNLWCVLESDRKNTPTTPPLVAFLGHTDVVPVGPQELWKYPPFDATVDEMGGILYGRGAVDMKGGIASFVVALQEFLAEQRQRHMVEDDTMESNSNNSTLSMSLPFSLGILLTSDEEGLAKWGTRAVLEELQRRGTKIDMAIIGEPSSLDRVGDVVKVGRRGSLSGDLSIIGIQGHVAYSHLARNPIHESLGALKELVDERWDEGTADFPPTSFQISNIQSGTGALNVIPGFKKVHFNFRYSPAVTDEELKARVESILQKHKLEYKLEWSETSLPFESGGGNSASRAGISGELVEEAMQSVRDVTGYKSRPCTSGGTSDGRFVAEHFPQAQIVELGHINETIHKIDECVAVEDLETLTRIYHRLLDRLRVVEDEKQQSGREYQQHIFAVQVLD